MNRQDIAAHIRHTKPHRLKVVLNDDTEKGVAIPRGRNRADKAAGIVDDMPWATVYMLDERGDAKGVFHRAEETAPATDLEKLPQNPTMAIVHAITSQFAPMVKAIHQCATESAHELVAKVRATHKDEMGVIFDALAKALTGAIERGAGFEQRANDLLAEVDELRDELAEMRAKQTPSPADAREEKIIGALAGELFPGMVPGNTKNAPDGANGANGVSG